MKLARPAAMGAAAFAFGGLVASVLYFVPELQKAEPVTVAAPVTVTANHPVWTETKWPFLMDQWGEGKAFQCKTADCGVELNLYIRPKIGFCSQTTGVADDSELERLSDFDFMNGATVALGEGHEIEVAWMKGRLRAYKIAGPGRSRSTAIAIAYNSNSDALVATVILNDAQPAAVEPAVVAFLNGQPMLRWVSSTLGL
jgi:hypothetical protein